MGRAHINTQANRSKMLSQAFREHLNNKEKLKNEFRNTLGARTFRLIGKIGLAEKSRFSMGGFDSRVYKVVRTSEQMAVQVPGVSEDYSFRFEIAHAPQMLKLPGRRPSQIYSVGTEIAGLIDGRLQRRSLEISSEDYVDANSSGVSQYAQRVGQFVSALEFAENYLEHGSALLGNTPSPSTFLINDPQIRTTGFNQIGGQ